MPTFTWYSPKLDETIEMIVKIAERDIPPDLAPHDWVRVYEMPAHTRKTYLDGQRKDLADFKAIAKLGQAAAELPSNDPRRDEIQREIDGRKKIGKKETKGV